MVSHAFWHTFNCATTLVIPACSSATGHVADAYKSLR